MTVGGEKTLSIGTCMATEHAERRNGGDKATAHAERRNGGDKAHNLKTCAGYMVNTPVYLPVCDKLA